MKARVVIEYEMDWPPDLDRAKLQEREAERWMTSETLLGLRAAVVKIDLIDEPGWWERPNA